MIAMTVRKRFIPILSVMSVMSFVGAGIGKASLADVQQSGDGPDRNANLHVVAEDEIQTRIEQQIDRAESDRQEIRTMLERPEIRRIAEAAGLSIDRASVAAANLSGSELTRLATQARQVNAELAGGDDTVVISGTTLIIVLLLLLLILR